MAPQQNSTFIDENLDDCPSFLSKPEEINHYSPILPPKNKENLPKSIKNNNYHNNRTNFQQLKDDNEQHKKKFYRNGSSRSVFSRRSRSISLYGVNSTVEQGHKEITIWLNDEPRYVSGVTNKTTCNDIIKALIDDEISNGNYEYCQLLEDGAASRDYNDYVITECWRGIERSYDGNMAILPVWKAWSRVQNEIRLSLKHHNDIQDPVKALKTNTTLTSIRNYICKLLSFGKCKKVNSKTKKSKTCQKVEEKAKQPPCDVILLLNPETNVKQKQEACHKIFEIKTASANIKSSYKHNAMETKTKINNEKLSKLIETRASVRKRRSHNRRKHKRPTAEGKRSSSKHADAGDFLCKRKDSCIRRSIRNKLAQKNAEMNELYQREYALTRVLTNKCKMYKLHNGLYTTCDRNLEMSVGQIQCTIEACAKEIIQTEHELLAVKNEIKNDISIINNLKRLSLETDKCERKVPIDIKNVLKTQTVFKSTVTFDTATATSNEQMQFVDNIYEFCDNNASMLV